MHLEEILDAAVGRTVDVIVERGGKQVRVTQAGRRKGEEERRAF